LMACGAVPITTNNPYTHWVLRDKENCMECYPTPDNVASAVLQLAENSDLYETLQSNATRTAELLDWGTAFQTVWRYIKHGEAACEPT
jgi:glycosyltransferase involved in cell wall biosynthesis